MQDIFVSKSTFSLSLVKLLASRALKLPLASVSRVSCPAEKSTYSYHMKKWLHEYKELIGNVSSIGSRAMRTVGRGLPDVSRVTCWRSSTPPRTNP